MADENLYVHKRIKRNENGKYEVFFLFFKIFKNNQLFKAKVITNYCGMYRTDGSKKIITQSLRMK